MIDIKNVVSLFDGISCTMVAINKSGYKDVNYYASEIDKYAIQISKKNWPDIIQLGDVKNIHGTTSSWINNARDGVLLKGTGKDFDIDIDLLVGGSPCQDLSIAKNNRKGLSGERSGLFYEYLRIRDEVKPKYFILENVASMPKEAKDTISEALGVQPIMINAALVSAQQRKRLFWVGKLVGDSYEQVNIPLPEDKHIYLKDILLDGYSEDLKSLCITASYHKKNVQNFIKRDGQMIRVGQIGKGGQGDMIYSIDGKSVNLSANGGGRGAKTGLYYIPHGFNKGKVEEVDKYPTLHAQNPGSNHLILGDVVRKLHPIECERLQCLPDGYTGGVSNTQRYKVIGNAFNVDVITHIIKHLK